MRFELKQQQAGSLADGGPAKPASGSRLREAGLTLVEVVVSVAIVAALFGVILTCYTTTATKLEWTGYSLAAQSLGVQVVEQVRSAKWDMSLGQAAVNEITNLTLVSPSWNASTMTYSGYSTNILDVPVKGTNNIVWATNYVTIQQFNITGGTNVPVIYMQSIRVDTVWPFNGWSKFGILYYTNSIGTYIAPDNRDPTTLGVGG